ncbi:MAG: class I SAM-dependent methyltransferase [Candidatus Cloacimonadota bacterium]|nr:class I SAM-dependent methyltransferase [Candidatus Cloacimonadota bacterium]
MNEITQKEKKILLNFIERNLDMSSKDLDEGIGTVYERVVIDKYFRHIQQKYNIETVLETPADGVTGIPGINSLQFARNGAKVFLTNPSKKMLINAQKVWKKNDLAPLVEFHQSEVDELPFKDNSFDLVWNYCMFERFNHPEVLLEEMKRVSQKYVMVMTQNFHNFGTLVHWLFHKYHNLYWDHGHTKLMTFSGIKDNLKKVNLKILEKGTIDTPPWMDTWDMPLRGEIKTFLNPIGVKWNWNINKETQKKEKENERGGLIPFLAKVEEYLPEWFSVIQTHHLYILTKK